MSKMGTPQNIRSAEQNPRLSEALTTEGCRRIIRSLRGRKEPITEAELAERVADTASESVPGMESFRIRLHHLHLPKLADVGLVDWDSERQTVSPTDHPVYDGGQPDELDSASGRNSVAPVLADDRRRTILTIVESENGAVARADLARELAALETDGEPAASRVENVTVQLHHRHLPKLADAGLLEYDREDGTITYQGPSELMPVTSRTASDA